MTLIEAVVLASFAYTSALWRWAYKKFDQITSNHLTKLEARVTALEEKRGAHP